MFAPGGAAEPADSSRLIALGRRFPEIIQQMSPRPPDPEQKIVRQPDSEPEINVEILAGLKRAASGPPPQNLQRQAPRVKRPPGQNEHARYGAENGAVETARRQPQPHPHPAQGHDIHHQRDKIDHHQTG